MSGRDWGDVLFLVFVLAVIMIMVRPGSYAPAVVAALGDAMAAVVGYTADSGLSTPVGTVAGQGIGVGT